MVDAIKLKAIVLLSLLVVAIGVPAIYYAAHMEGERNAPPVAVIDAPNTVYVNETVKFSALGSKDDGHITTYLWNFGDGTKSAGSEVTHKFTRVGIFTVTLTVYDNEGANSTATMEIKVEEMPTKEVNVGVDELLNNISSYIGLEVKVRGIFAYGRNYSFYMVNSSGFRGIRVYVEPGAPRPERMEYGDGAHKH
jgi:PKD repeat protein